MDSFSQIVARSKSWLDASSSTARVASIALLTVGFASLLFWSASDSQHTMTLLFQDAVLRPSELKSIELALGLAGLDGYVVDGGQIRVPANQRAEYFRVITEQDCLETYSKRTDEAFKSTSLLEPGNARIQRLRYAKTSDLRAAICRIDGISDAMVQFDEKVHPGLRNETEMTASVSVDCDRPIELRTARLVAVMLLGSKAGLRPEHITITDIHGTIVSGAMLESPETQGALQQQARERHWQQRLKDVLSFVPGVALTVTVHSASRQVEGDSEDVVVSVNIPSGYLDWVRQSDREYADATVGQLEAVAEQKVRNAMQGHLPNTSRLEGAVAVSFIPVPTDATQAYDGIPRTAVLLFFVFAGLLVAAGFAFSRRKEPIDEGSRLRVYESPEEEEVDPLEPVDDQLRARLRTLVDQDPDAAAQSLAEWIDQAG